MLEVLGSDKMYLGEIAPRANRKLSFAWPEFAQCVNYLFANGYMEREGDGFGVRYWFTDKGKYHYQFLA